MMPNAIESDQAPSPPWWAPMVSPDAADLLQQGSDSPPALELRLPDPAPQLPGAQGPPAGDAAAKSRWARYRRCGLSGGCCAAIIIVVVCCVLLLAAAAYYYYTLMRARAYLTVTIEIPATSLSSSLGAGLKCDFAATLGSAQPPIDFGDISLDSFALTDEAVADVQISPTDVRVPGERAAPCACARARLPSRPFLPPSLLPHPHPHSLACSP
jgi:hypothetical protein